MTPFHKAQLMFGFKTRHRRRLLENPIPVEWDVQLSRGVPYASYLPPEKQDELRGLIQVFLDEKGFEGCGGLQLTDEIRVTIAGYACIMLLGGQSDMYPKLRAILVYPGSYIAPHISRRPDGTVSERLQGRSGESWSFGNIVLSWKDIQNDSANVRGRNVVFHEFAHQLDFESGSAQGAPILPRRASYADWARVLGREYESLVDAFELGRPSLLDQYGASDPAEFFAVATECFFLKPKDLRSMHTELYSQLQLYYRQDPCLYNLPSEF